MAKSKIIKELANSSIDTATALKRLKILLLNLNKPELNDWVNHELNGYENIERVPPYRIFSGRLTANFVIGNSVTLMKYTNTPLPTINLPDGIREKIEEVIFRESISAINSMKGQELGKVVPPEFYNYLREGTNISSITSAKITINNSAPVEIISAVENKILEILVLLENEFGILDDLDIDCDSKSNKEIQDVCDQITNIIYVDKSITIGNENKLTKTDVST